jgi:hypothetical protein
LGGLQLAPIRFYDGVMMDLSKLPEEFHPLIPYIRRWAVGDDVERSDREEAASTEELQELSHAVWPKMPAINAYLDMVDKEPPYSNEAAALGRLAECVCELQFVLQERTGNDPTEG